VSRRPPRPRWVPNRPSGRKVGAFAARIRSPAPCVAAFACVPQYASCSRRAQLDHVQRTHPRVCPGTCARAIAALFSQPPQAASRRSRAALARPTCTPTAAACCAPACARQVGAVDAAFHVWHTLRADGRTTPNVRRRRCCCCCCRCYCYCYCRRRRRRRRRRLVAMSLVARPSLASPRLTVPRSPPAHELSRTQPPSTPLAILGRCVRSLSSSARAARRARWTPPSACSTKYTPPQTHTPRRPPPASRCPLACPAARVAVPHRATRGSWPRSAKTWARLTRRRARVGR
jgi:hypothetical protein